MNSRPISMAQRILAYLLMVCLVLSGCSPTGDNSTDTPGNGNNKHVKSNTISREFNEFTETIFRDSVASDALSLNYTLAHPEAYGIPTKAGGFKPISYEQLKQETPENENLLYKLRQFNKDKLSLSQKVLYDSLAHTLEMNQKGDDFLLFSRPLSPTTGLQAQLPVLLAEYQFDCTDDIDDYFALLQSIPEYFASLLAFMERQADGGYLPPQSTLEEISSQCLAFTEQDGCRILISSFARRIKSCDFLQKSQKKAYRKNNRKLVQECIIPAYTQLINGINVLQRRCGTNGSLCSYPDGKAYYEYLFARETGSDTSADTYFQNLTTQLTHSKEALLNYAKKDPSLFSKLSQEPSQPLDPTRQLQQLSQAMTADFPSVQDVNFKVSTVDKSLEEYLSPAFYLTPPLDAYTENAIYINKSPRFAGADLAPTLAHEGYPGHLYQNVYHRQQDLPLLCYALHYGGYTEGWATYAENYAYKYLGYTKDEVGILRNNAIVSLCIYGLCDIGIHYYGWTADELLTFLQKQGTYTQETAQSLYHNIIDEPGSYLKYTIGFMEFAKLKKAAKAYLGDRYTEMAFHTFVLSVGPAPFSVLHQYMKEYLNGNSH